MQPPSDILIIQAGANDIPVLLDIEQSVAGSRLYSAMTSAAEWSKELAHNSVFLIQKNGVVVGSIMYEVKSSQLVEISGLAIRPEFQGQGIGRTAFAQLLAHLTGYARIDLAVHPENVRAIALYRSFGFMPEETKENYFGDGEPRLILAKTI